jgi:hypothetical protein
MVAVPARERDVFRRAYGKADERTWARARGWALSLALVILANSADNPQMARIGRRTLREVLGSPARRGVQAARRRTSQMVAAMSSADSATSQPLSIHWNVQNRLAGW